MRAYGTILNQCAKFDNFLPRRSMGNGCMSNFDLLVELEHKFDWLLWPNGFGCCDQNFVKHGQKIISAKLRENLTKFVVDEAF